MSNSTRSPELDQAPRRFGKLSMRQILAKNDEDFMHYIRLGDDVEAWRLDDLEALVRALADRPGNQRPQAVAPSPAPAQSDKGGLEDGIPTS